MPDVSTVTPVTHFLHCLNCITAPGMSGCRTLEQEQASRMQEGLWAFRVVVSRIPWDQLRGSIRQLCHKLDVITCVRVSSNDTDFLYFTTDEYAPAAAERIASAALGRRKQKAEDISMRSVV